MDFKRITSGFIVGLVLIVILLIPYNIITGLLFTLIAIVGMHEYLGAISKVCKPVKWVAYLSCAVVSLFAQVIATDMKTTFKDMAYTLLGICYIPTFLMFLTMIDKMQNGKILLGYIFIASWGTDIFAYCIGKRFGKHKFSKVSPKKSIEGCIAGTIGATILALIYTLILNKGFSFEYSYIIVGILGIVLSLIGQLGDFSASCIKRYVDIKDYSNLLPGHGGMLDRIDSVLFIAPFAYMLFTMI